MVRHASFLQILFDRSHLCIAFICITEPMLPHSQYWYFIWEWRFHSITSVMRFPLQDKIMGGYPIKMKLTTAFIVKENRKYISDKKQIKYILTQNGIAIPVHFKSFRVQWFQSMIFRRHINAGSLNLISFKIWVFNQLLSLEDLCRKDIYRTLQ